MLTDGGEHVEERPLVGRGKAHAAGRDQRHTERIGQAHQRVVVVLLIAAQVPLQFDIDIAATEERRPGDRAARPRRNVRPAAVTVLPARPALSVNPSKSSSVSAPSPFGARSFMRVIRRHRLRQPSCDSTSTGNVHRRREGQAGARLKPRLRRKPACRHGTGAHADRDTAARFSVRAPAISGRAMVSSAPMMARRPADFAA